MTRTPNETPLSLTPEASVGETELDRLISRFLDNECTSEERRALNRRMDSDAAVRCEYEDYAGVDREAGHALRLLVSRTMRPARPLARWLRIGRAAALATAACLAAVIWIPERGSGKAGGNDASGASLFAAPNWGDLIQAEKPIMDRPHIREQDSDRRWIMIPSERPGEFLLIELNRTRTRAYGIHGDY